MIAERSREWSQEQVCGPEREQSVEAGTTSSSYSPFLQFSVKIHLLLKYTQFAARKFSAGPKV